MTELPETAARKTVATHFAAYLFALPAFLLFAQGALTQIDLPGLYFDAINPDYLVLRLFSDPKNTPVTLLPGNVVFNALPVLIQVYHGALPFYFGFPVYLLFGTGMLGVRVANLVFGLLVLGGLATAMRSIGMNRLFAGLALAALALDSGSLFAFRTQFYITTLPLALAFASLAMSSRESRRIRVAGALAGLSVYGYFCFAFVLPALAWRAWRSAAPGERFGRAVNWAIGCALGLTPYALGLLLVLSAEGGPAGFVGYFRHYFGDIAIVHAMSLTERIAYAAQMLVETTQARGPAVVMTNGVDFFAPALKAVLLLGGTALAFALSLQPGARWQAAQVAALGVGGIFGLFLLFGDRAWLHHAAPALPLMYLGLAALGDGLAGRFPIKAVFALLAAPLVALIFVNAVDRQRVDLALIRTGGVNFYSDGLTHFEQDAQRATRPMRAFFPDWGLLQPFNMMTGGLIPSSGRYDPEVARRYLCGGRDVLLALMANSPTDRLDAWIAQTDWPAPERTVYRQRDGIPVLISLRWRAEDTPQRRC